MEQRSVQRFRTRAILAHWYYAASASVLLVTGAIMLFGLTNMSGGRQIRTIHEITGAFLVAGPVLFTLFDPKAAFSFLREAFHWERDDLTWLRRSIGFYFGRRTEMPRQGYTNGDQKLWQLVVIVTGIILGLSGLVMWFFKLKMPQMLYQGILTTHIAAFVLVSFMLVVHFYLVTLYPRFDESLSSMVDGKISPSYARENYGKWYATKDGGEQSTQSS